MKDPETAIVTFVCNWSSLPDYTAHQFQGIIRNVVVNGEWINLFEGHTNGVADVVNCESAAAEEFKSFLLSQYELLLTDIRSNGIV